MMVKAAVGKFLRPIVLVDMSKSVATTIGLFGSPEMFSKEAISSST
jgi:hypothetical protein